MILRQFLNKATVIAAPAMIGMLIGYPCLRADNDNNGSQDEKQMIQIGMAQVASLGINLRITNQDPNLVGLGSYLVNVTSACNSCHTPVFLYTTFKQPTGNPYFVPPVFNGTTQIDPNFYLSGGFDFGPPPSTVPPSTAHMIARNLTPDKNGLPEGRTLSEFLLVMQTGADPDHFHLNCGTPGANPSNCVGFPVNGTLLQVMPWPFFQNMTTRQLTAIYTFLSTIPCIEGDPGNPSPPTGTRCK